MDEEAKPCVYHASIKTIDAAVNYKVIKTIGYMRYICL